ncbi:MAG: cupin domain-containing protein [Patescibacteria group bacterium]
MKIIEKESVVHVGKEEGIEVDYYLFDEYEVHYNEQAPHSEQKWHRHARIWETVLVIEGELIIKWKENDQQLEETIRAGDMIEVENSPHTFINNSNQVTKFIVIKQVLSGKNKRDIFRNDKVVE